MDGKNYRSWHEVFSSMEAFSDRSEDYEKTARMKRAHTRCSVIVDDVTKKVENRACGGEDLAGLERCVENLSKMLVEILDKHRDSGPYTVEY